MTYVVLQIHASQIQFSLTSDISCSHVCNTQVIITPVHKLKLETAEFTDSATETNKIITVYEAKPYYYSYKY